MPGSFDPASRRTATLFAVRLGLITAFAVAPCLAGSASIPQAAGLLSLTCGLGGLANLVSAKLRRETVARGSLNGWDEALAFLAVSRLAHLVALAH